MKYYSSRTQNLYKVFLNPNLSKSINYDRIAGYFSSSIFSLAKEPFETYLEKEGKIRIICNSDVEIHDTQIASFTKKEKLSSFLMEKTNEQWRKEREQLYKLINNSSSFEIFYKLLKEGKIEIKVIPKQFFGLLHGKAGVFTFEDGRKTSFIGSANETFSAWDSNYELIWENDELAAINFVENEFNSLWNHSCAIPLSDYVIEDIGRIQREVKVSIDDWRDTIKEPASVFLNTPLFKEEIGFWDHQKDFIELAYDQHVNSTGARFVLADVVGLGKTLQLAAVAQLIALYGEKPILIITPKTLLEQWQEEIYKDLNIPSAIWSGSCWVTEEKEKISTSISKCPRKIGLISQGLIINQASSKQREELLNLDYDCIIVDESHRARRHMNTRKNYNKPETFEQTTNLLKFLHKISSKTKSMLLATATPFQLDPIEMWDLLYILNQNDEKVLGNKYSMWSKDPVETLKYMKDKFVGLDKENLRTLILNPLLPSYENIDIRKIRNTVSLNENKFLLPSIQDLSGFQRVQYNNAMGVLNRISTSDFLTEHNPYTVHIIRRTRSILEQINPKTGNPYLNKIDIDLVDKNVHLPVILEQAYKQIEEFCQALYKNKNIKGNGFIKTMLLRRIGSSMEAGYNTVTGILYRTEEWKKYMEEEDFTEDEENNFTSLQKLNPKEIAILKKVQQLLEKEKDNDPKYDLVRNYLESGLLNKGCILFSQYFDTAQWFAKKISVEYPQELVGLYAGGGKSGIYRNGQFTSSLNNDLKHKVKSGEMSLFVGTDAASEGLNLQKLGSLINLDLPYNPTRLEQRKGRIYRIGQNNNVINIVNMRYECSVEQRVHELLSSRLGNINAIFGQVPDIIKDIWIEEALQELEERDKNIERIKDKQKNIFNIKERQISPNRIDWNKVNETIYEEEKIQYMKKSW